MITDKTKVKHILFITLSNIGDVILTLPALEALLNEFPDAKLDVMVSSKGSKVFEKHKRISDIILYDKKMSPLEKFGLFLRLRKKGYDMVADLRNTVLPFVLGAGFITSPFGRSDKDKGRLHKKDVHLSRLEAIGIDTSKGDFFIPVGDSDEKHVEDLLKGLNRKPFVAIAPGAKSHVKRWPSKNFAKLSDMIKESLGHEVIFIGDKNDRIVVERILSCMKTTPVNLIEKTNIRELACLVEKAKLLITNDSAPLHVASAVGAGVLAFFGPTDDKKYGPVTKGKSRVLRKNIRCAPCEVPQCINIENKYECLKTISVEEAFGAVKELLVTDIGSP